MCQVCSKKAKHITIYKTINLHNQRKLQCKYQNLYLWPIYFYLKICWKTVLKFPVISEQQHTEHSKHLISKFVRAKVNLHTLFFSIHGCLLFF